MKLLNSIPKDYDEWIGNDFVCPVTKRKYQLEVSDISQAIKDNGEKPIDYVICPDCKGKVMLDSDYREKFLRHVS